MDWTQEEREKFQREQCSECVNEGLYTCKMILTYDNKCMFFKDEEE